MNEIIRAYLHKGLQSVWILLACVLIIGCGGVPPKRVYQPNPPGQGGQPMPLKIAVIELEDHSPGIGFRNLNTFEIFTPGYFYWTEFQKYHQTRFGKCVAAELKESQLFQIVDYYPTWEKVAQEFRSYDVIVTGRLLQDRFERVVYTYGLCDPMCMVWFVGAPMAGTSREAKFELTAFQSLDPNHPIWTYPVLFQDSKFDGALFGAMIYGVAGGDFSSMHALANGHNISDTDYCPTQLLQPHFLAMRNSLGGALKQHMVSQIDAALPATKSGERKAP